MIYIPPSYSAICVVSWSYTGATIKETQLLVLCAATDTDVYVKLKLMKSIKRDCQISSAKFTGAVNASPACSLS